MPLKVKPIAKDLWTQQKPCSLDRCWGLLFSGYPGVGVEFMILRVGTKKQQFECSVSRMVLF